MSIISYTIHQKFYNWYATHSQLILDITMQWCVIPTMLTDDVIVITSNILYKVIKNHIIYCSLTSNNTSVINPDRNTSIIVVRKLYFTGVCIYVLVLYLFNCLQISFCSTFKHRIWQCGCLFMHTCLNSNKTKL